MGVHQNATVRSRHCAWEGQRSSWRSMPVTIAANRLWSSVQMRIRPACACRASAHSRAIGAKSRLLRVINTRPSDAASSSMRGSGSPSLAASPASARTSWPGLSCARVDSNHHGHAQPRGLARRPRPEQGARAARLRVERVAGGPVPARAVAAPAEMLLLFVPSDSAGPGSRRLLSAEEELFPCCEVVALAL